MIEATESTAACECGLRTKDACEYKFGPGCNVWPTEARALEILSEFRASELPKLNLERSRSAEIGSAILVLCGHLK